MSNVGFYRVPIEMLRPIQPESGPTSWTGCGPDASDLDEQYWRETLAWLEKKYAQWKRIFCRSWKLRNINLRCRKLAKEFVKRSFGFTSSIQSYQAKLQIA